MIVGVALGIGIGTAVKVVVGPAPGGSGAVAIGIAVLIALVAALALGGGFFGQGFLFVNQSATSAILMMAVAGAATGTQRLLDALIGGGATLLIAVVLFPAAPLPLIRDAARQVFAALRDTVARLGELASAGRAADPEWVLAVGQRIHRQLAGLPDAGELDVFQEFAILMPTKVVLDVLGIPHDHVEQFVAVVSRQNLEEMDPHYRPQYYEGRFAVVKYDFIGRMEAMPDAARQTFATHPGRDGGPAACVRPRPPSRGDDA